MARRSDHTRDELSKLILSAARELANAKGLRGLTARQIADKIGYAPGTIYNVFANLDDLIMQLRGATLDELYDRLSKNMIKGSPEVILINIAYQYIAYVSEYPLLWNIMFEHRLPDDGERYAWYHEKTLRLLGLAEQAIAPFFNPDQADEFLHHVQVLWASLQGICYVHISGKLIIKEPAEGMAESLITNYIKGLRYETSILNHDSR